MESDIQYDLLFVRHGISCANVVQNIWGHPQIAGFQLGSPDPTKYRDPNLALSGVEHSRNMAARLDEIIGEVFGTAPYGIGASCMIRTQETAYCMALERHPEKRMNIFPHIGEDTSGAADQADNIPFDVATQKTLLLDVVKTRIAKDARESEGALSNNPEDSATYRKFRSNFEYLIQWMILQQRNNTIGTFFERDKTADGAGKWIRRAVIFTHAGFLGRAFGQNVKNNGILRVRFSLPPHQYTKKPQLKVTVLSNEEPPSNKKKDISGCNRICQDAAAVGGRRKSRKQKKKSRKQSRKHHRSIR